jgi:ketosteroid isomerase-like protein
MMDTAQADNIAIARELVSRLGSDADPDAIVELFAEGMTWDVPGDTSAFPWIGRQSGRQAVRAFLAETAAKVARIRIEVDDILASDTRAVMLGRLASRVKRTGRMIATDFAIILTIAEGRITRFQMLEDSFAVSQAAQAGENPDDLQP